MIIKCRFIPKDYCVNIFGTYWVRDASWIDDKMINHERIHTRQQRELLFIPFYIFYGIEWLIRLVQYRNSQKAYMNISFEREAYGNGDNLEYLPTRRLYSWIRYMRRKINTHD